MFEITPYARRNRLLGFYDPFKEMEELEKSFFGRQAPALRTDVKETDQAYLLEADLPGFSKEDICIEVQKDTLVIRAERKANREEKDENGRYIRRERSYGSYTRSFGLDGIQSDAITAAYQNGVLSLTLPKVERTAAETRRLEIQ